MPRPRILAALGVVAALTLTGRWSSKPVVPSAIAG